MMANDRLTKKRPAELTKNIIKMAEGMGFEPTIRGNPYNGLANRRLQPLGHPSFFYNTTSNLYWIFFLLFWASSFLRFFLSESFSKKRRNFNSLNTPSRCNFLFNALHAKSTLLSFTNTCNNSITSVCYKFILILPYSY